MGCGLCSEVVWERSEVGGRTIRSGFELGNREECFQRWRVLVMGRLAAAARFGRGKHHCHLICALGRWRRRWCRWWWWWCWSECRRRVAAVRSEFGFRDGWSREICCCCNGIGSSRGARASTLKQSQITLPIMATTLSFSAQVSFSAWCFFPLPTIPQFLSLLLSLLDSSILSLCVFSPKVEDLSHSLWTIFTNCDHQDRTESLSYVALMVSPLPFPPFSPGLWREDKQLEEKPGVHQWAKWRERQWQMRRGRKRKEETVGEGLKQCRSWLVLQCVLCLVAGLEPSPHSPQHICSTTLTHLCWWTRAQASVSVVLLLLFSMPAGIFFNVRIFVGVSWHCFLSFPLLQMMMMFSSSSTASKLFRFLSSSF